MIKFTPTHYCPVKNPNRLVKIGTCSILEVVKPLILNKKVPTMHYNSIFQQHFNFLPRHRFEDAVKYLPSHPHARSQESKIFGRVFLPLNASGRIFRLWPARDEGYPLKSLRGAFAWLSRDISTWVDPSFEGAKSRSVMLAWYWCGSKCLPAIDGSWRHWLCRSPRRKTESPDSARRFHFRWKASCVFRLQFVSSESRRDYCQDSILDHQGIFWARFQYSAHKLRLLPMARTAAHCAATPGKAQRYCQRFFGFFCTLWKTCCCIAGTSESIKGQSGITVRLRSLLFRLLPWLLREPGKEIDVVIEKMIFQSPSKTSSNISNS